MTSAHCSMERMEIDNTKERSRVLQKNVMQLSLMTMLRSDNKNISCWQAF